MSRLTINTVRVETGRRRGFAGQDFFHLRNSVFRIVAGIDELHELLDPSLGHLQHTVGHFSWGRRTAAVRPFADPALLILSQNRSRRRIVQCLLVELSKPVFPVAQRRVVADSAVYPPTEMTNC